MLRDWKMKSIFVFIMFSLMLIPVISKADNFNLSVSCHSYECLNVPLFISVFNESLINTSNTAQLQILANGITDIPFQWYNATSRDIAMFFVNITTATNNTATNYTVVTNSGSTHNVSTLFPKDLNTANGMGSNVRANVYNRTPLYDYSCGLGNCVEFTWSSERDLWGGGSIKANTAGGDDKLRISFTDSQNYMEIWFYDNMDAGMNIWVATDDTGGGSEVYVCGVRTATSADHYVIYNGAAYLEVETAPRFVGWHRCEFRANGVTITSYIDGHLALFDDADVADIDSVDIYVETEASISYWDMFLSSPTHMLEQVRAYPWTNYTLFGSGATDTCSYSLVIGR
jgi:hypothetical protein